MKLVKKMLAITFTFMMIVGMSTNVKAMEESQTQTDTKGTITVTNVPEGHTYKLYKILNLESYSYESGNTEEGNYAYTLTGDKWDDFVKGNAGEDKFFTITDNKYVTFNKGEVATLAKEAMKFAEDNNLWFITTSNKDSAGNFVFSNLNLGYYLVDSSVGALCNLTTTNPTVTIQEKNGTPTVEKKVKEDSTGIFDSNNTADIGETVEFQTIITAQTGAHNYVLHDKMSEGLTFNSDSVIVKLEKNSQETTLASPKDYEIKTANLGETDSICTFHIEFKTDFCNSLNADDKIIVSYSATLNKNAVIGDIGNKNDTWLKYGDGKDTAHSSTLTKTFEIPVFKYTGAEKKGLGKAKFTLKNANGSSLIQFVKVSDAAENTELTYRVAKTGEENTVTEIKTPSSGKFTIQGLDADTYFLTEKEQPKGYNKLASPITIVIETDGKVKLDGSYVNVVEVENKTGTILPSTGGMGTTIIYMVGAILVIGSGIVLLSKKKSKVK